MLAAMDSSTKDWKKITIHVRLLDEAVDVWRPVEAMELNNGLFLILPQPVPSEESWEFLPGEVVAAAIHDSGGREYLIARAPSTS